MESASRLSDTKGLGPRIDRSQETFGAMKMPPGYTKDQSRRRNLRSRIISSQPAPGRSTTGPRPMSMGSRPIEMQSSDNSESDYAEIVHYHRRPRANISTQRDTTPPRRDYDLLIDQRFMEMNDERQDLEIAKHQQEINRLERELIRRRDASKGRYQREEEEWYEDEIDERLRRLERFEKKARTEAKRQTEEQLKLQRLEEAELSAKRENEVKAALREKRLEALEKEAEEKERRERIKKELGDEEARRRLEEQERTNQENRIRIAAIEEYKLAEQHRLLEEERRKMQLENEVRAAIKAELGYTLEQVKVILTRMVTRKARKHRRGRTRAFSTTDYDIPSGDEADMEAS
ncbi:uncharacterized protein BO80DRAFT_427586 [Aspergillus ibericus CBS 121593]|uniref:Uncharacterized protein n=1 Tax=Aspergillus ibericus CBS 121593 TaxID=1448316 RepID=A0A395GRU3_9EURO|nr:hypothetical protein BO80DRAFT_427586 [Aspergillus ibericus CBS 121593]RAK98290.1 hypothetical protein BO80DRAFT_427586 [Aspergillus ibericus CBS 121593]